MLNIDMLCHCPKRLSLPICDVRDFNRVHEDKDARA